MKYFVIALAPLIFAGCGLFDDSEVINIRLDADAASYRAGEEVVLTLSNTSGRALTVHPTLCGAVLQQFVISAWVPEHHEGVCTLIALELESGEEVVARRTLAQTLAPGEYRFKYTLLDFKSGDRYRTSEQIDVYTNVFFVLN